MLRFVLLFNLILCPLVLCKKKQHKKAENADDLGGHLVSALRNDVNIDLPADEEYEDLRAELLAYHTALASITNSRRSMKTTPCWQLGGICVDHRLCEGHRFLTEVPGCKSNSEVCCFTWNNYHVRDMKDKGIDVLAMPWSQQREIGGKGVLDPYESGEKKRKKKSKRRHVDKHHDALHDDSHHGAHHNNVHHDISHHDNIHHEDIHHDHIHNEQSHHEKPHDDNPPVLVILRTKK